MAPRIEPLRCPPYATPPAADVDGAGVPIVSILELAARLSSASNEWRVLMDGSADYRITMRAAATMARASDAVCHAVADAVASGDNRLS